MPGANAAPDTVTVGADGALRLVYQGRHLVLGRHQIRLLHALWQTAGGWLPRASIPAVLAGVPFVPTAPAPAVGAARGCGAEFASLAGAGADCLDARGARGTYLRGDALLHVLVAWAGRPDYWGRTWTAPRTRKTA